MAGSITTIAVGVLIAVLGAINMTGNISSLHWYHRQRVTEEDRLPFGKAVGLGTLICGLSCVLFGGALLLCEWVTWQPLLPIALYPVVIVIRILNEEKTSPVFLLGKTESPHP